MDYVISSDPNWVDVDVVWRFLSEESYWARGIPRETVLRSLPHSILFGVYETGPQSGREQVGFARVISDRATFAYLADVFISGGSSQSGIVQAFAASCSGAPRASGITALAAFHGRCTHALRTIWFRVHGESRTNHGDPTAVCW